ncbi:MAG: hypothetical protein NT179_02475 [Nitrospirae bacterium]|nr:hypothetical protein [Nitrospirota bacterium]
MLLSLLIITATGILIVKSHVQSSSGVCIDIARPLPFYGIFYFMYYLLPFLMLALSGQLPHENQVFIALLIFIGYVACSMGMKYGQFSENKIISSTWLGQREAQVLLVFCAVGIGLVAYAYVWRVSEGIFFNQARYYEQERTIAASVRDVFAMNLQLPIILLLGFLSTVSCRNVRVLSRVLFWSYGLGIIMVLVLSSQTRPAITALIFFLVGLKHYRNMIVGVHHALLLLALCFSVALAVQMVRLGDVEAFASSENQFLYAVKNIGSGELSRIAESMSDVTERVSDRAGGGINFLSDVIDAIDAGESHLYGEGIGVSLHALIPRFLWEDKPSVTSPQLVAQELLNMPVLFDTALGPVTQFYIEFGWLGVAIGYFCFGWLMGKLTSRMVESPGVGMWIIFSFVWSYSVNLERELVIGIIDMFRNALFVYVPYRCIMFFSSAGSSTR